MTDHVLKTIGVFWDAVALGDKTFEVRRDDRAFQRGDHLTLRRLDDDVPNFLAVDPVSMGYKDLHLEVTYVLRGGQLGVEAGYVVLGLAFLNRD